MSGDAVDQFLRDPRSHQLDQTSIGYIETHISQVYLTPNRVYKRKKALKLDFLNYQDLEQRHQACLDELRLNRRLAPKTYRQVLALYQGSNGPSWQAMEPNSPVIEWLVEMERLPHEQFMDNRLLQGEAPTAQEFQDLAQVLTSFFKAESLRPQEAACWLPDLKQHCHDNGQELLELLPEQESRINFITARQLELLFFKQEWFEARLEQGYICEGHGDLKPEHICLLHPPVVFDCIEFDRHFRVNDVLDEMSFLALECEFLGYPDLAQRLVGEVLEAIDGSTKPHPFYLSYRACVRAKVEAIKSKIPDQSPLVHLDLCQKYLQLAEKYAEALGPPRLIAIGGLMGSGKTTIANALSRAIGARHLESDRCRQMINKDSQDHGAGYGQGLYQPQQRDLVYHEMLNQAQQELKLGRSVIIDASFILRKHRTLVRNLAHELGIPFHLIWCECPAELAKQRITKRRASGKSSSHARAELYDLQQDAWEKYLPDEARIVIDSGLELEHNLATIQAKTSRLGDRPD